MKCLNRFKPPLAIGLVNCLVVRHLLHGKGLGSESHQSEMPVDFIMSRESSEYTHGVKKHFANTHRCKGKNKLYLYPRCKINRLNCCCRKVLAANTASSHC